MITRIVLSLLLAVGVWFQDAYAAPLVKTGAQVLHDGGYGELAGKRVGLITNHTAQVEGTHLIDLMHGSGKVRLAAIFAPEHGLRGLEEDGVQIREGVDERTGVPVYSLYGKTKKPSPEMLNGLDLLVFDIQDIGSRFYTYISTMGLAMQAAAEAHIPFIVLDRPNPLGGDYVSGFTVHDGFGSFVGQYPIPVSHGLTIGELALMIKGERMLPGLEGLDLRVMRMDGWHRAMRWPETGLTWIKTSPNIPDYDTALVYPGLCFLEATTASEGRGTFEPFKLTGLPEVSAEELVTRLNAWNLPGVKFEPAVFIPRSNPGMCSRPKYRDRVVSGIRLVITDPGAYRPVETGVFLLCAYYAFLERGKQEEFFKKKGFDLLAGTDILRKAIQEGRTPGEIISAWGADVQRFEEKRRRYFLY